MKLLISIFFIGFLTIHTAKAQGRNLEKFVPSKDMVSLDKENHKTTLKKGQQAYFQYSEHYSVGSYGEVIVADTTVLKVVSKVTTYERPHEEGMTGDDKALTTVVLEAVKEGKTEVVCNHNFRGKTEKSHKVKVTVK